MKNSKSDERAQKIEEAIRTVFDSLQSHLPYTYEKPSELDKKRHETRQFHKKCVAEYSEVIDILANLY